MIDLSNDNKKYFSDIWQKIDNKMKKVAVRSYDKIPYTAINGVHDNRCDIEWWTNGFWPGLMWIMYAQTKNEQYMKTAINAENKLRDVFTLKTDCMNHDCGFMWDISSGVHYRLTKDEQAKRDTLLASYFLMGRFNVTGGYIRAWDDWAGDSEDHTGWTIIDCMMNLPLLYRATEMTGDDRFKNVAKIHADKTIENHIRNDGSVRHIVEQDPVTGEYVIDFGGQGYGKGSSWSRGQAWALYGFIFSYIHTYDERYLDTAKRIANYFISCLSNEKNFLPLCDFRSPETPVIYDSTAGVCAACGLIEIASVLDEYEKELYLNSAIKLLKSITENFVDFTEDTDALLHYGTEAYHAEKGRHIPIIYGDYFYIEAVYKLINEKRTI